MKRRGSETKVNAAEAASILKWIQTSKPKYYIAYLHKGSAVKQLIGNSCQFVIRISGNGMTQFVVTESHLKWSITWTNTCLNNTFMKPTAADSQLNQLSNLDKAEIQYIPSVSAKPINVPARQGIFVLERCHARSG